MYMVYLYTDSNWFKRVWLVFGQIMENIVYKIRQNTF
jgi:hypothetical protein